MTLSPSPAGAARPAWVNAAMLAVFVAVPILVGQLGNAVTLPAVRGWYQVLRHPAWTPPDWVFAPVWTVLYVLMGVAAWLVWRHASGDARRRPLGLFALQLGLNLAWSLLFFGLGWFAAAGVEIVVLWLAILATARAFAALRPLAGWLLAPYLAWVAYAAVLNGWIWALNRGA